MQKRVRELYKNKIYPRTIHTHITTRVMQNGTSYGFVYNARAHTRFTLEYSRRGFRIILNKFHDNVE